MKRIAAIGIVALAVALAPVSRAQYTADYQTNIISGVASNWVGDYRVGDTNRSDVLVIQSGGALSNASPPNVYAEGLVGYSGSSSNNSVLVTDNGSVWRDFKAIGVGVSGSGNLLVVSNGAAAISAYRGFVGIYDHSTSNVMVVTGSGSMFSSIDFYVGFYGPGNSLIVSKGGVVSNRNGGDMGVGYWQPSDHNVVLITDPGSAWEATANSIFYVGYGASNKITVANSGRITTDLSIIDSLHNQILVTGTGSVWESHFGLEIGAGFAAIESNVIKVADGAAMIAPWVHLGKGSTGDLIVLADGSLIATNASSGLVKVAGGESIVLSNGLILANQLQVDPSGNVRGCGTISAAVINDGNVTVDCSGSLTFTGAVTNNGTMRVLNGSVLESYGPVVNNGIIDVIFGSTNFHGAFINNGIVLDANGDPDGDGQSNIAEALAGTDPTNSASAFRILGVVATNDDVLVTWATAGGRTNVVQSAPDVAGSYTDISPNIFITGTVETTTNYLDACGATNGAGRYYHIRLVP